MKFWSEVDSGLFLCFSEDEKNEIGFVSVFRTKILPPPPVGAILNDPNISRVFCTLQAKNISEHLVFYTAPEVP